MIRLIYSKCVNFLTYVTKYTEDGYFVQTYQHSKQPKHCNGFCFASWPVHTLLWDLWGRPVVPDSRMLVADPLVPS